MARLFVAVWPPPAVLDLVGELPRPERDDVRWTTRDQWHVTLRFLGAVDDVEDVVDALAPLADLPAPVAVLGPATEVLGGQVVVAPVNGLDELAAAIVAVTATIGEPPEERPFRGHLTVARHRGRRRAGAGRTLQRLAGVPVDAKWPVTEVTLVQSHLGRAGARYETVAAVPLA